MGSFDIIIINLFVGSLTKKGDKRQARRIFSDTLRILKRSLLVRGNSPIRDPFALLIDVVLSLKPLIVLESKRVGGVIYRLPRLITRRRRSYSIAVHWLIKSAMMRKERGFALKLANEILDTARGKSASLKKKNELYDLAINNRPFIRHLK